MELRPGTLITYRNIWHGQILDVFKSEYTGKIILRVLFVKNIFKQQLFDTIEYTEDSILPTTARKILEQIGHYDIMQKQQLDRLDLSLGDNRGE